MREQRFQFWRRWLTYANVMALGVGFLAAFASNSFIFDLYNNHTEAVFFNGEPFSPEVIKFKTWIFAVLGATIIGFHVLMIFISEYAFKKREKWSYYALWTGLMSWFLIDTTISAAYGAFYNILMINVMALILIAVPLLATWKVFIRGARSEV